MIKNIIYFDNNATIFATKAAFDASSADGFFLNHPQAGNGDGNGNASSAQNWYLNNVTTLLYRHKGTVNAFPLYPKDNIQNINVTWPLENLFSSGENRVGTTLVRFLINEQFTLPSVPLGFGYTGNSTIDTEGEIVPGRYGFQVVKRNVGFNERNRWYIEILIKENTSRSDFGNLLKAELQKIDKDFDLVYTSAENNNPANYKITNNNGNFLSESYDITLDELSSFAFSKDDSVVPGTDFLNNRVEDFIAKLLSESDANYGFDYTYENTDELYPHKNDKAWLELIKSKLLADSENWSVTSLKYNEPSFYRTVDEKINKVLTFIGPGTKVAQIVDNLFEP